MLILKIMDSFSDFGTLAGLSVGGTGLGYLGNRIIQKIMPTKKEEKDVEEQNAEILSKQLNYFENVTEELNKVIKQLQEIACYREPCNKRINGKKKNE